MAYMSQEKKVKIAPKIKAILAKYKVKGSLAVRNQMTLCLNLKSGSIDFIANSNTVCGYSHYYQINPYHFKDHYDGKALAFLQEVFHAMNDGNHDRSDVQSDYFDVGWYVDVNLGKWNKPYQVLTFN